MSNPTRSRPLGPVHDPDFTEPRAGGADPTLICIFPGCERPAIGSHALGGPPSRFCDDEQHNALTTHLERRRRAANRDEKEADDGR